MKTRSQIAKQYQWDLTIFCKNDQAYLEKCNALEALLPEGASFEGKLSEIDTLWKFLQYQTKISELIKPLGMYIGNAMNVEMTNSHLKQLANKLDFILLKMSQTLYYVDPEMNKFSDKYIDSILADTRFKDYDYIFKRLKVLKKHTVSKEVSKALSGMDFIGFSENHDQFSDTGLKFEPAVDNKGKKHELSNNNYSEYIYSPDRSLRKSAMKNLHLAYGQFNQFLTNNYQCDVKATIFESKLYKYNSVLEHAIIGEDVSLQVYETLIQKVHENIPVINDYYLLKKKVLNLETMYNYDIFAPLSHKVGRKYTYEQAIDLICKALSPLGDEYVATLRRMQNEHWIDVMPCKNKASGAYSSAVYGYPPIILTNFTGNLDSVFTLAHEMGHSMHSYYSCKMQPEPKSEYTIFLAEIASTTNEMLLLRYLLNEAKNESEKYVLYDKFFEMLHSTCFRQTMFSEFEQRVYEMQESGEGITSDALNSTYQALLQQYMKKIKVIPEMQYEWSRIPHFYRPFYVYKYASGILCALNFSGRILAKEEGSLNQYINFLSAGGSTSPIAILREAGCDLEKPETLDASFDFAKQLLREWKNAVSKK